MACQLGSPNPPPVILPGATLQPEKVFVGGLAEETTAKELEEVFTGIAPVQNVTVIVDRSEGPHGNYRRYAFVAFYTHEDVNKVLWELSGKTVHLGGRRLIIGQSFRRSTLGRAPSGFHAKKKVFTDVISPRCYSVPPAPVGLPPYYDPMLWSAFNSGAFWGAAQSTMKESEPDTPKTFAPYYGPDTVAQDNDLERETDYKSGSGWDSLFGFLESASSLPSNSDYRTGKWKGNGGFFKGRTGQTDPYRHCLGRGDADRSLEENYDYQDNEEGSSWGF